MLNTKVTDMHTQHKRIHVLLSKLGLMEQKPSLVSSFTNGRTERSSEMTEAEAKGLATWLQQQTNGMNSGELVSCDRMRKNLIAIAYEMGWASPGNSQKAIADIDKFCQSEKSPFKKPLMQHTHMELVQLVTQFKQMYKKHLNSI